MLADADLAERPPAVSRPLRKALGRVLAEDIRAAIAVPNCDNSAMDGYALRAADGIQSMQRGRALKIAQRIPAGSAPIPLQPNTAARIFTGAPVPPGADAVIPQEHCAAEGGELQLLQAAQAGDNIRRRGQDIEEGALALAAGRRLQAADLGVLASIGCAAAPVFQRLRVALLSTGDEIAEPGPNRQLAPGQVFNSNRFALRGLLAPLGLKVREIGPAPGNSPGAANARANPGSGADAANSAIGDSLPATVRALEQAAQSADCIISTGGVSVGEEDHVRQAVARLGEVKLWRLRLKPGKPLAYGRVGKAAFFGLPGNPAAVFITFAMLVRPWLLRRQGASLVPPVELEAAADFDWPEAAAQGAKTGQRLEYLRARVEADASGQLRARLHPNQSSGVLSSLSWANALVIMPPGASTTRGAPVRALLLDQLSR